MYGVVTVYLAVNVFSQRFWSKHISRGCEKIVTLFQTVSAYAALWRVATKGGLQMIALQNTKITCIT